VESDLAWYEVKLQLTYPAIDEVTGVEWARPTAWDWQGMLGVSKAFVDSCRPLGSQTNRHPGKQSYEIRLVVAFNPDNEGGEPWARPTDWNWWKLAEPGGATVVSCERVPAMIGRSEDHYSTIRVLAKDVPRRA
jgi:hypothetical protein